MNHAQKHVHLICNAHLDPVWLWEMDEGIAEALSTFRIAAELCESHEGFVFNHNEALLYQWVLEHDPDLFTKIQWLVQEGKWHIMGGWFLQSDCNMPSGEALVRQILVGRATMLLHTRGCSRRYPYWSIRCKGFTPASPFRTLLVRRSCYDA